MKRFTLFYIGILFCTAQITFGRFDITDSIILKGASVAGTIAGGIGGGVAGREAGKYTTEKQKKRHEEYRQEQADKIQEKRNNELAIIRKQYHAKLDALKKEHLENLKKFQNPKIMSEAKTAILTAIRINGDQAAISKLEKATTPEELAAVILEIRKQEPFLTKWEHTVRTGEFPKELDYMLQKPRSDVDTYDIRAGAGALAGAGVGSFAGKAIGSTAAISLIARRHGVSRAIVKAAYIMDVSLSKHKKLLLAAEKKDNVALRALIQNYLNNLFLSNNGTTQMKDLLENFFTASEQVKKMKEKEIIPSAMALLKKRLGIRPVNAFEQAISVCAAAFALYHKKAPSVRNKARNASELIKSLF